jgi:hypothetical protein
VKDVNLPQLVCQCLREAVSETKTMSNFDTNSGMVFFMVSTLTNRRKTRANAGFSRLVYNRVGVTVTTGTVSHLLVSPKSFTVVICCKEDVILRGR